MTVPQQYTFIANKENPIGQFKQAAVPLVWIIFCDWAEEGRAARRISLNFVLGLSFVTQNERTYVAIEIVTSHSVGPSWGCVCHCVVIFLVVGYMHDAFFTWCHSRDVSPPVMLTRCDSATTSRKSSQQNKPPSLRCFKPLRLLPQFLPLKPPLLEEVVMFKQAQHHDYSAPPCQSHSTTSRAVETGGAHHAQTHQGTTLR
jgi:hypothetical protein